MGSQNEPLIRIRLQTGRNLSVTDTTLLGLTKGLTSALPLNCATR